MAPTLGRLPGEMQIAVADCVDRDGLLALRLVSRDLCAAAEDAFLDDFFTQRQHLATKHFLEALLQIVRDSRLSRKLQSIKVVRLDLPHKTETYAEPLFDQVLLQLATRQVTPAFKTGVDLRKPVFGRVRLESELGDNLEQFGMLNTEFGIFSAPSSNEFLMACLVRTHFPVSSLAFWEGDSLKEHLVQLNNTHLERIILPVVGLIDPSSTDFTQLNISHQNLKSASSLKHVNLRGPGNLKGGHLPSELAGAFPIIKLVSIHLNHVNFRQRDLSALLRSQAKSLRELRLHCMDIEDGDSWQEIFQELLEFQLERLAVTNIGCDFEDDWDRARRAAHADFAGPHMPDIREFLRGLVAQCR